MVRPSERVCYRFSSAAILTRSWSLAPRTATDSIYGSRHLAKRWSKEKINGKLR